MKQFLCELPDSNLNVVILSVFTSAHSMVSEYEDAEYESATANNNKLFVFKKSFFLEFNLHS